MITPSFYDPTEFAHIPGWDPKPRVIALLQTPAHCEIALRLTLIREPIPADVCPAAVNAFLLYMNAFKSVISRDYPQAHRLQQLCSNECGRRWRLMNNTDKAWWVEESARHRVTVAPNPNSRARRRRRAQGDINMIPASTSVVLSARRGRAADIASVPPIASVPRRSTSSPRALGHSPCSSSSDETFFWSPTLSSVSAASSDENACHASTETSGSRTYSMHTKQAAAVLPRGSDAAWLQHIPLSYVGASRSFNAGDNGLSPITLYEVEYENTDQHSVVVHQSPTFQHAAPNNNKSLSALYYYAAPSLPFQPGTAITNPAHTTVVVTPQPHYATRTASVLNLSFTNHAPDVYSSNTYL